MFSSNPAKSAFTVSELSTHLNQILRSAVPVVQVVGEVSQITRASSGHWYLTLKDQSAMVKAVMFKPRNVLVGFVPAVGDRVEVLAQVGIYEPRGDLQLNLETLRKAGQGGLYEQFLRLKAKLEQEGLFARENKQTLPAYVLNAGVITSRQAAALADVQRAFARRVPHVAYSVYHSLVQGTQAVPSLLRALAQADRQGHDVLLLVRGGGSLEDLWCFNDEQVVRAVAACKTPIVVGVGHESDFTLAEFAADVRAATPTAAVELISPPTVQLRAEVDYLAERLQVAAQRVLARLAQQVDRCEAGLVSPQARLEQGWARSKAAWRLLGQHLHAQSQQLERHMQVLSKDMAQQARRGTHEAQRRQLELQQRCMQHASIKLAVAEQRLQRHAEVLQALSPQRNLEKGYAFLQTEQGRLVASVTGVEQGQSLRATLADGQLTVQVHQKVASDSTTSDLPPI